MKGMLVKTKKELAEAKKQVRVLPKAKERISFCSLVPTFRERSSCQGTPNPLLNKPSPLPVPPKKEVLIKNTGQGSNGMIMLVDVKIYFS